MRLENNLRTILLHFMAQRKIETLVDLAIVTGVSRPTLSKIFNRHNYPASRVTLRRLSEVLGCEERDLM